jgi:hypothetical protein
MIDPLTTLFRLNEATLELDEVQGWINHVRVSAPTNQRVQLELDRQQAEINERRELIEFAMIDISSRN